MPAVSPGSITQDFQQGFRFLASRNTNDTVGTCQSLQFSRLLHIAGQEDKKFLGRPSRIAQIKYVASEQRHNFFRRDLLDDRRHAKKGATRPRNRNISRYGGPDLAVIY